MANSPAPEVTTAVVSTVADFQAAAATSAATLKLRPLSAEELAKARDWATTLVPEDLTSIPDYINLAGPELEALTTAAHTVLGKISVEDMKKVKAISQAVLGKIDSLNIDDLSPEAKAKVLGFKETLKQIIKRIDAFFDRYRTVQSQVDNLKKDIINMRDHHTGIKNDFDQVGKETKASRNVLRIVVEACKIFLQESGYPEKAKLVEKANADKAMAEKDGRLTDETLVENLSNYNSYLQRVEKYMSTMEGAIVDAHQTYEALEMLENNERIIAQTLDDLIKVTLPAWERLIVAAWGAYQAKGAAGFVHEMNAKTSDLRRKTADMLGESADSVAALIKEDSFDTESMQYMNDKLTGAMTTLADAADEAAAIHTASREAGYRMIERLSEVALETASRVRKQTQ